MKTPQRILILSASSGAGHVRAASAIEKAIISNYPDWEVHNIDALDYTNRFFKYAYSKFYINIVNRVPSIMGILYHYSDKIKRNTWARAKFNAMNASYLVNYIRDLNPSIIICTHFLTAEIVSFMKRKQQINATHYVVVTDLDVHAAWIQRYVDHYFVAIDETKQYLKTLGITESSITVSGIPVDPVFSEKKFKEEMRIKHGFALDKFIILVSTGGYGIGPVKDVIEELDKLIHDVEIIVVCGNNSKLTSNIKKLTTNKYLRVYGFVDIMDELMDVADLFVGKPGGLTTSECLCKGLPMVIFNPIPGQEERNSDHLLECGIAIRCNSLCTLSYKVDELILNSEKLRAMKNHALFFQKPEAAFRIADYVCKQN